jgi:hypothetical protein
MRLTLIGKQIQRLHYTNRYGRYAVLEAHTVLETYIDKYPVPKVNIDKYCRFQMIL